VTPRRPASERSDMEGHTFTRRAEDLDGDEVTGTLRVLDR
jgi:hypothetical protein